ncbi:hypothetical protein JCM10213_005514 [Rhodosporidiobolus nylandii]
MARKSTRTSALKAKRALKEADNSADEDFDPDQDEGAQPEEDEQEEEYVRPVKKKARTSRAGGGGAGIKGTKGALKGLLDLPLDILAEVCWSLDLQTIFHLSRLNSRFYRFLRDPTMRNVWEAARETSGLPELTAPGCSIYQLANLVFGGYCQGCAKATTKVDYILRLRTCKACTPEWVYDERAYDQELYRTVPYAVTSSRQGLNWRNHREVLYSELQDISHLVERYADWRRAQLLKGSDDGEDETSEEDDSEDEDDVVEYAGFSRVKTAAELSEFSDACSKLRDNRQKDGEALIAWQRAREEEKELERQAVRDRRRKAIEERLQDLGWHPHHFQSEAFINHSFVYVAKEFNERSWSTMRGPLEACLREAEADADATRIATDAARRQDVLHVEFAELAADTAAAKAAGLYPLPPWLNLREFASVKKLWDVQTVEDTYEPDPSLEGAKEDIAADLANAKAVCKQDIFSRLIGVLKAVDAKRASGAAAPAGTSATSPTLPASAATASRSLVPAPADGPSYSDAQVDEVLSRAISLVKCLNCQHLDTFPRILGHNCSSYSSAGRASFAPEKYGVDVSTVDAALQVIELANKSVEVKASEMDPLGHAFTCSASECKYAEAYVLDWRLMVDHLSGYRHITYVGHADDAVFEDQQAAYRRLFEMHVNKQRWAGKRGDPV